MFRWKFDTELNAFTVTSLEKIPTNFEIFDSYGRKCNHRFLLNYGFALLQNDDDDGYCPNTISLLMEFHIGKKNEISNSNSDLDMSKELMLQQSGILIVNNDHHEDIRGSFSKRHSDLKTREGLSLARLYVATKEEIEDIPKSAMAYHIRPISIQNECRALEYIASLMQQQVVQTNTTIF